VRSVHRPHLLGIDDGPVAREAGSRVVLVGVMMEGPDLVESVCVTRFPVDGDDATGFLASWITGLRCRPALQGAVLGGITIAGLGVIDIQLLAEGIGIPVLVVNRRDPRDHRLARAFRAAGLTERLQVVERRHLVRAVTRKSDLPEPLRVAHLIARAISTGESRGRA
jgi:endonuclease V-like protein UPF0215 family